MPTSDEQQIRDAILENLSGPRQGTVDGVTIGQHSLPDQLKALDRLEAQKAMRNPAKAMMRVKITPPGSV